VRFNTAKSRFWMSHLETVLIRDKCCCYTEIAKEIGAFIEHSLIGGDLSILSFWSSHIMTFSCILSLYPIFWEGALGHHPSVELWARKLSQTLGHRYHHHHHHLLSEASLNVL
jgi:hypothetical protein